MNTAGGPATILLGNGVYNLAGGENYLWIAPRARDLIIRSVSGNRDAVAVRGTSGGYSADVRHCFMVAASNVTIADMTIGYCAYHGIQVMGHAPYNVAGLHVHNCHFINCDRGIGYGLSIAAGGFVGPGTIRNNVIYNDGHGLFDDVGIGLEYASLVTAVHNTVWLESYWAAMEYRFAGASNAFIANNLVNQQIARRDGASALVTNNITDAQATLFVNLAAGDLHLLDAAATAIDRAITIHGVIDDLDGDSRPHGSAPDIGADEVVPEPCFMRHCVLIAIAIFCRLKTIRRTLCV